MWVRQGGQYAAAVSAATYFAHGLMAEPNCRGRGSFFLWLVRVRVEQSSSCVARHCLLGKTRQATGAGTATAAVATYIQVEEVRSRSTRLLDALSR